MGEQEAIGLLGTAKGLSTGAAGVLDLAGWAMVKQANMTLDPLGKAIGFDLTLSAPEIAKQVGEGFDFMGDQAFGKEKFSRRRGAAGRDERRRRSATSAAGSSGASRWPAPGARPRRARRRRRC